MSLVVWVASSAVAQGVRFGPAPGLPAVPPPAATACVASAPPPVLQTGGRLVLQLTVRRHRVALVTTATTDPAVAPLAPCFERELVGWSWSARRAEVEVPVVIDPSPSPEPASPR
jgi:hypothetical protein